MCSTVPAIDLSSCARLRRLWLLVLILSMSFSSFFFFNDTATTEIYTLSLHDALPISGCGRNPKRSRRRNQNPAPDNRSEEHTSELQSQSNLVCRLLLEKKKKKRQKVNSTRES